MKVIFIEVGHGRHDAGAAGRLNGKQVFERDLNLLAAVELKKALLPYGFKVILSRIDNETFYDVDDLAKMANKAGADLYVALHADSAGSVAAKGHHVIYSVANTDTFAKSITQAMGPESLRPPWTRLQADGRDWYGALRLTNMEAVIVERGFVSNTEDLANLQDPAFTRRQMQGLARAICQRFGVDPQPAPKESGVRVVIGGKDLGRIGKLEGGKTMVPIRVFEMLGIGASVSWDASTLTATVQGGVTA